MSSTAPPLQLLVVGLCGEAIFVPVQPQDTVELIKDRAFANASQAVLADGSRHSLVLGVSREQLCLVFGEEGDAAKLEDTSLLQDCVGAHLRSLYVCGVCGCIPHNHCSELTDAATQRFARRQLMLASATSDMDGFVEVELGPRK